MLKTLLCCLFFTPQPDPIILQPPTRHNSPIPTLPMRIQPVPQHRISDNDMIRWMDLMREKYDDRK